MRNLVAASVLEPKPVKSCPLCARVFTDQDLVADSEVQPIGMQFYGEEFSENLYFFNHLCPTCGTTFTVHVMELLHLIDEPIPAQVLAGTEHCERHCRKMEDLRTCNQDCSYAPFRRFLVSCLLSPRRPGPEVQPFILEALGPG